MIRSFLWTALLWLSLVGIASAQETQRRLVKLDSRIYGWYAVAEPAFDHTIGRRELFKISGADQFLKGLSGRLVIIEGVFSGGTLHLPALAPPPISVSETCQRRIFLTSAANGLRTEDGFSLTDPQGLLPAESGHWALDLVVEPSSQSRVWEVRYLLSQEAREVSPAPVAAPSDLPLMELTLSQDLLDTLMAIGLQEADLQVGAYGLNLGLTNLRVQLPQTSAAGPWSLQGSVEFDYQGRQSLAESSFKVDAQPVIEDNLLKLEPDWNKIDLEGQLPFAFVLSSSQLASLLEYLPNRFPILSLNLITKGLKSQGLLADDAAPQWNLSHPGPGNVKLSLLSQNTSVPDSTPAAPGEFRLVMGTEMVDRLIRRQVQSMLDPHRAYSPDPPIEVGKALFIPILVKDIFIRNLKAGYQRGALRFDDLIIDVGWEAGPLSGVEPLLQASGYVIPKLVDGPQPYWSWQVKIEDLEVRSDKIPGDKATLAREFRPQIESSLGEKLAQEQRFSTLVPLSTFTPAQSGTLEITRLIPLDATLTLEGKLGK